MYKRPDYKPGGINLVSKDDVKVTVVDKGITSITTFPDGENVVDICQYKGRLIVATTKGLYELKDGDTLHRIRFKEIG